MNDLKKIFPKRQQFINQFIEHQEKYDFSEDIHSFARFLFWKKQYIYFKNLLDDYNSLTCKLATKAIIHLADMCAVFLELSDTDERALGFLNFLNDELKMKIYTHPCFITYVSDANINNIDLVFPYWCEKLPFVFSVMNMNKLLTSNKLWSMFISHPEIKNLKLTSYSEFYVLFLNRRVREDRALEMLKLMQVDFDEECSELVKTRLYPVVSLRRCLIVLDMFKDISAEGITKSVLMCKEDDPNLIRKIFDHRSMAHIKQPLDMKAYLKPEVALIFQERYGYLDHFRQMNNDHPDQTSPLWEKMEPKVIYFLMSRDINPIGMRARDFENVPEFCNLFDRTFKQGVRLNPHNNDLIKAIMFGKPLEDVKSIVKEMKRRAKLAQSVRK
jgi:hypothetical protein